MKKVSNLKRVINLAKNSPDGFTVEDVKKVAPGIIPNSLYSMLWKLKKTGFLTHNKETGKYTVADAAAVNHAAAEKLTPVNKPKIRLQSAQPLPPKGSQEREIRELNFHVQQLRAQIMRMEGQYNDALAIIRYVEDKLFKAIQHDARNGSNS